MRAALLVDPYYNGPSSLEMRQEYYEPIVRAFPEVEMIPYVIPGRTGTQLLPQDIAILAREYPNLQAVKEATGSAENARLTRRLCGPEFSIMSGDDDKTLSFMRDDSIACSGVISVISNIAPRAVEDLAEAALAGNLEEADRLGAALQPLFGDGHGEDGGEHGVRADAREGEEPAADQDDDEHPGMDVGPCRRPLGLVTRAGLNHIIQGSPDGLDAQPGDPRAGRGGLRCLIEKRLHDPRHWEGLAYGDGYD